MIISQRILNGFHRKIVRNTDLRSKINNQSQAAVTECFSIGQLLIFEPL